MADIELVIKIDKEQYKFIKQSITMDAIKNYPALLYDICEHIANGTVLPKRHGDLIDISKLPVTTTYFGISDKPTEVVNYNCILNAKKIIKADKTQNNKIENKK